MSKTITGIDVGLSGAVVQIDRDANIIFKSSIPTKENILDIHELWKIIADLNDTHVYLEKVSARPGQGVSSMFKFGRVYGITEALLVAANLPYTLVTPQKWQNVIHAGIERSIDPKNRSDMVVKRLFPREDLRESPRCRIPHKGIVDALLIAEYGRRTNV